MTTRTNASGAGLDERLAQNKDEEFIACDETFIRKVDGYEFKEGEKVRSPTVPRMPVDRVDGSCAWSRLVCLVLTCRRACHEC